jgi:NADH dehydrogenase
MKKVFVLGGTGFVGTAVCQQLVKHGWQVTVATRQREHAAHLLSLPLTLQELDVHDPHALAKALAGQHAVVNLVAILHGTPAAFNQVHVALPQNLAAACCAASVKTLLHVSALGADARQPQSAPSNYLRSKGQGEAALLRAAQSGAFHLIVLRPSVIFGAGDKFLNVFATLQKRLPLLPLAGAATRFQPVWVEDVADAVRRCLERASASAEVGPPLLLELCGPEVFTLRQLVQLAARLAGVRGGRGRPVIALPSWLARLQAGLMELAPGEPLMSRDNLDSMRIDNVASGKLAGLQSLGISPAALQPIAAEYLKLKYG